MFHDHHPFGEPDATAGGFLRYLYERLVPPPIPSPVPTRVQVDEFGRPVSPLSRHLRGLQGFVGPLVLVVPGELVLLFAAAHAPAFMAVVVGLVTLLLLISSVLSLFSGWTSAALDHQLRFLATSLFTVLALALVAVSFVGGWRASSGWLDFCGALAIVAVVSVVINLLRALHAGTTLRDCLVWSAALPAALLVCLMPLTVTDGFPLVPFAWGVAVNTAWATLVGRNYLRFVLYNEYLEYGAVALDAGQRRDGRPLIRFMAADLLSFSALLLSALFFFVVLLEGHGNGADQLSGYLGAGALAVILAGGSSFVAHGVFRCESAPFGTLWVCWRAVVVFVGWRSPRAPGAFDFPGPWSAPALRVGFTALVLMTNTMLVELAAVDVFYPRIMPNMVWKAARPTGSPPAAQAPLPPKGPLAVSDVPWWAWLGVAPAVFVAPAALALAALMVLHGARLLAWHEFVELRLQRSPPPLDSLWLDIRERDPEEGQA